MNLTELTVPQLRQLAAEVGIVGRSRMRKAELIAALTEVSEEAAAVADESLPLVSPVRAAINALETYLEVVGRLGAENGGPAVSAAWEDYLDASFAAETCTVTTCWDRATDDGRCGRHSWGAPLGQDVAPGEPEVPSAQELVAADVRRSYDEAEVPDPIAHVRAAVDPASVDGGTELGRAYLEVLAAEAPQFGLDLAFIRGTEPSTKRFDSAKAARAYVRRELTDLSSIWQVWVTDPAGRRIERGTRSGRGGTGRSWTWAPVTELNSAS